MRKFSEKLQLFFMAAAFAESGEFNTAREIIEDKKTIKLRQEKRIVMRPEGTAPRA